MTLPDVKSGEELTEGVIAMGVSWEDYMEHYAQHFCEWVEGTVIKMSPVHELHDLITRYLAILLEAYFSYRPIGQLRQAPFVMKLERSREPDLQIILNDNTHELKPTYMDGPADICIEVVSPGNAEVDYGAKFIEYEKGGVREYWLFDPLRKECRFHRLNNENLYVLQSADEKGIYRTPLLPGLEVNTTILWTMPLPNFLQVAEAVKHMVEGAG